MTTNEFMAAYLEGRSELSKLERRIDDLKVFLAGVVSSFKDGELELRYDDSIFASVTLVGGGTANITVSNHAYVLAYLQSRVICHDISDLRDALLEMLRKPEMH